MSPAPNRPPDEIITTEHRCDLCADPTPTHLWVTQFNEDIVWPESSLHPTTRQLISTTFSSEDEWGVCEPCRQFIDKFTLEGAVALIDRLDRHYAVGTRADVRRFMQTNTFKLGVRLTVEDHGPWDLREIPDEPAIHRMWYPRA